MSRILLNNNFKLLKVRSLGHESVVDRLCYDELDSNTEVAEFRKKIVSAILANELYKSHNSGLLIPTSSRFYSHGRSMSDKPDFADVLRHLELKLRIKEFECEERHLKMGAIRFKLLNVIPYQIMIFIEIEPGTVLLMARMLPKLYQVATDFLVNDIGSLISPVELSDVFLKNTLNSTIEELGSSLVGELELAFANIKTTNNALNQIIINVPATDVDKFPKTDFTSSLFGYLRKSTALDFEQLRLTKIRCNLYLFLSEGRLRFTNELSFAPFFDESDPRPSLWPFVLSICDLCMSK
ncbi:hypothetical protein KL942_004793 [Ogataea angusta]|uniref:Uncharacterized protein n=1 Tax=Pichia angusta TaxID=870730 RepID=A0ABQ7RRT0_PICAN|nr:hypothetical protein KL909_004644 [Ogataea angusta]KAG7836539.1 hypothetical protein KL942_004793 [Ogataea angusta]KAG7846281.1 hypothetical protein KL940_004565 [Ogataea angusta]